MKAGATPELSATWWKKNKAKSLTKTGLSDALRKYEKWAALDKNEDIPKQIKALSDVKRAVAEAFKKSHPKIHKETQAALKKYPKIIDDRIKVLKDLETRVNAAPKQKIGKQVVIWNRDIAKEITSWQKSNQSKFSEGVPPVKKGLVKLTLNDDILDVLEESGDFVTPAYMVEDAEKEWKSTEAEIQKAFLDWEKERKKPGASKKAFDNLDKTLVKAVYVLERKLEKIPAERFAKFKSREKKYKDYKVKAACDAAFELTAFTGNVALAVGSGGLSLALSVYGLVKSASKLCGMLYDACIEAETVYKSLEKDLAALKKSYLTFEGEAKKMLGPKEVGKATIKGVFGDVARPFIQSIPRCESNFDLWDNKVAGLEVKGRKCSQQIVAAIDAVSKCEKALAKESTKRISKLLKDLKKLRGELDKALNSTTDVMARVREAEGVKSKVEADLKQLQKAQSLPVKVLSTVIPHLIDIGVGAWAGVDGVKNAKSTVDTIKAAESITIAIEAEAKAIIDEFS
jgi:DNA repair exonuclease SbcCD ATPase subunit